MAHTGSQVYWIKSQASSGESCIFRVQYVHPSTENRSAWYLRSHRSNNVTTVETLDHSVD